jgi:hypothetical protein
VARGWSLCEENPCARWRPARRLAPRAPLQLRVVGGARGAMVHVAEVAREVKRRRSSARDGVSATG